VKAKLVLWSDLSRALIRLECDRDPEDMFCVQGNITNFMGGGEEFLLDEEAVYYRAGKPRNLYNALVDLKVGIDVGAF